MMSMFWRMAAARGLIKMVNNNGESGHNCLVSLSKMKLCEVSPPVMILAMRCSAISPN